MSMLGQSFRSVNEITENELTHLFQLTKTIKSEIQKNRSLKRLVSFEQTQGLVAALLFFEPSTRTRLSFEIACKRLGVETVLLDSKSGSSLAKGEAVVDTVANVAAMNPDLLIYRHSAWQSISRALENVPSVNAGTGTDSHPTQALLDVFTMQEKFADISGLKVLIVGDVQHSRVAHSNLRLLTKLGAEVGICGPEFMLPQSAEWSGVQRFTDAEKAFPWADVCMGLRIQTERHQSRDTTSFTMADYRAQYKISMRRVQLLKKGAMIMHPGPFVPGVDFDSEVLQDPRCVVRDQVSNGVYVRAALLAMLLKLEIKH